MTSTRFCACLRIIHLTDGEFLRVIGREDGRLLRRWKNGERDVPQDVAAWLEGLAQYWEQHAPPQRRNSKREDFGKNSVDYMTQDAS